MSGNFQKDRERLERRLEEMENGSPAGEKQTADLLRLQELEVENGKLQEDLKRLRQALADDAGDNSQFKEMIGERLD